MRTRWILGPVLLSLYTTCGYKGDGTLSFFSRCCSDGYWDALPLSYFFRWVLESSLVIFSYTGAGTLTRGHVFLGGCWNTLQLSWLVARWLLKPYAAVIFPNDGCWNPLPFLQYVSWMGHGTFCYSYFSQKRPRWVLGALLLSFVTSCGLHGCWDPVIYF